MPINTLLFDFSYVLLFPREQSYTDELSSLYKSQKGKGQDDTLGHFKLNEELLDFLDAIKDDYQLNIFTASTVYHETAIKRRLGDVFENIFSTVELGVSKSDPKSYSHLAQKLDKDTSEILFIDDTQNNVAAARAAGLQAIQYQSNEQVIAELKRILKL